MNKNNYFFTILFFKSQIIFFLDFITTSSESIVNSHFSESKIAMLRVDGIFDKIIFIITIIGTDNNIQIIHHIAHQNKRVIIITKGLKFNLFHINFGSTIFQIIICTLVNNIAINIKV
jgi:hypothetical protein